jgi:hypothetical protein
MEANASHPAAHSTLQRPKRKNTDTTSGKKANKKTYELKSIPVLNLLTTRVRWSSAEAAVNLRPLSEWSYSCT